MSDKLPMTQSASAWPSQFTIQRAADLLDMLGAHNRVMGNAWKKIQGWPSASDVEHAKEVAQGYERRARERVGVAETLLNQCEPDSWYDENGCVEKSEVAKMLAVLMGSFPTSSLPDAKVFTAMLLEDVMAVSPFFPALEGACRELRTTKTFMPAIAETVAAVKKHDDMWSDRYEALDHIEGSYDDLIAAIAEAERKIAAKAEAEQRRKVAAIEYKPSPTMAPPTTPADLVPAAPRWWTERD